jgi:hypothetical protein
MGVVLGGHRHRGRGAAAREHFIDLGEDGSGVEHAHECRAGAGRRSPSPGQSCEHAFVSPEQSPYVRFRRSLETRRLADVLAAAAEMPWINLTDSLEILTLMAHERDPRFDRAAARWIGRLLTETPPMTLTEARWVIAMVEQLPRCRESLHRFARRH